MKQIATAVWLTSLIGFTLAMGTNWSINPGEVTTAFWILFVVSLLGIWFPEDCGHKHKK